MTTVDGVEYAIITSSLTGDTTGHGKMWVSLETGITVKGEGEIQTKNEAGEPTVGKVSAFVVRPDGTPLIP